MDGIPVIDYTETSKIENVLAVYDIEAKHDPGTRMLVTQEAPCAAFESP